MVKPTVGRIVWYWPAPWPAGLPLPARRQCDGQPQAAIVCGVVSDTILNLSVFTHEGRQSPESVVRFWDGEGERPTDRACWQWMPYQLARAQS